MTLEEYVKENISILDDLNLMMEKKKKSVYGIQSIKMNQ